MRTSRKLKISSQPDLFPGSLRQPGLQTCAPIVSTSIILRILYNVTTLCYSAICIVPYPALLSSRQNLCGCWSLFFPLYALGALPGRPTISALKGPWPFLRFLALQNVTTFLHLFQMIYISRRISTRSFQRYLGLICLNRALLSDFTPKKLSKIMIVFGANLWSLHHN